MRVVFTGTGEAFDEHLPNTSILVEAGGSSVLLDCGFTAPSGFWKHCSEPLKLDVVYLTHLHGDHFFGLPALLVRFIEEGRTKDLTVIVRAGGSNLIRACMEMAYPGTLGKAKFGLRFVEAGRGRLVHEAGFDFSFAENGHTVPCLSVRLDRDGSSLFYSGDGRPSPETLVLAKGVDLVIHEAFSLEKDTPGHGTVSGAVDFACEAGCRTAALVHIQRDVRRGCMDEVRTQIENGVQNGGESGEDRACGVRVIIPEPGDELTLGTFV